MGTNGRLRAVTVALHLGTRRLLPFAHSIIPPNGSGGGIIATEQLTAKRKKAIRLADQPTVNFYELAGLIVDLHDGSAMQDLAKETAMSRRRMYYLLQVGQFIRDWKISQADAERVGWTKLQIIALYVNQSGATGKQVAKHMRLALETRSYSLLEALQGSSSPHKLAVVFRLSAADKAELLAALTGHGAEVGRRGLGNKGDALMKMVRAATVRKA